MSKAISFIVFLLYLSSFSQTTISGDISGMTFKPSGNPWIVKENVYVVTDGKTVIKPGCIFLFKPFTGLVVSGSLEVEGQDGMPVVFTSINDSLQNEATGQKPDLFDWNGIMIEQDARRVKMSHFLLMYSVFGIKSKKDDIVLEKGIFRQNGQFNLTINEKIQDVISNIPFDYNSSQKAAIFHNADSKRWEKPTGIISVATGTVFLGIMGYFIYSATEYNKNYGFTRNREDIAYFAGKRDDALRNALITGIMGGLLVPGGTGLLVWNHRIGRRGKQVTVYPVTGESNGFTVAVKF